MKPLRLNPDSLAQAIEDARNATEFMRSAARTSDSPDEDDHGYEYDENEAPFPKPAFQQEDVFFQEWYQDDADGNG